MGGLPVKEGFVGVLMFLADVLRGVFLGLGLRPELFVSMFVNCVLVVGVNLIWVGLFGIVGDYGL